MSLQLKSEVYSFEAEDYYIAAVQDERVSQYFLGKVFLRNQSLTDLLIDGGTENAFLNNTRQGFRQNRNGVPLIIKIEVLAFSEKRNSNGLIDGYSEMKLKVFGVLEQDTLELCSPRSSNRYNRSLGTAHELAYEPLLRQMWVSCIEYLNGYVANSVNRLELFNTGSEIIIEPFSTQNRGDTVHYFSRKVTWNDFKGRPPMASKFAAAIFPSIGIGTKLTIRNRKLVAIIKPQVFMIPSQSWVKSGSLNSSALRHEQLHFDITKVVMDRLIEKLKKIEANTMDDLSSMIQYEYLQSFREMNKLQQQYDDESRHNLDRAGQAKWEEKVQNWLREGS
ncbi:hypothetical protein [Jiulongibacter sediminis]|uniref:hypothetical protein n=1 Tax=Jiulongibacter sediminis TaxID=1605367 RepID=UPI0006DC22A6|nr:hypothetical protein [Jiulongibacter sediminis]